MEGSEVMEEPPAARVAEVEVAARGEGWVCELCGVGIECGEGSVHLM